MSFTPNQPLTYSPSGVKVGFTPEARKLEFITEEQQCKKNALNPVLAFTHSCCLSALCLYEGSLSWYKLTLLHVLDVVKAHSLASLLSKRVVLTPGLAGLRKKLFLMC